MEGFDFWQFLNNNWVMISGIIIFIGSLITFLIKHNIKINNATNDAITANKGLKSHEKLIDEKVKSVKNIVDLNNTNMEINIKGIGDKLDLIIDKIEYMKEVDQNNYDRLSGDVKEIRTKVAAVSKKVANLEGKIDSVVH